MRVADKKQIRRIVLERLKPHESGHCSWRSIPDYELTDHAGKRRKLSDLQGPDPMVLVLSRGDSARRIGARPRVWSNFYEMEVRLLQARSRSVPTTCF